MRAGSFGLTALLLWATTWLVVPPAAALASAVLGVSRLADPAGCGYEPGLAALFALIPGSYLGLIMTAYLALAHARLRPGRGDGDRGDGDRGDGDRAWLARRLVPYAAASAAAFAWMSGVCM